MMRRQIENEPDNFPARMQLAVFEHRSGNMAAANREARIATSLRRNESLSSAILALAVRQYGALGFADEARELYELLIERERQQPGQLDRPARWAGACIGIGDFDCVLKYLKVLAEQRESGFRHASSRELAINSNNIPELEQPEFVELRKQLGWDVPGL
jgi:hypothetical protein